MEFRTDSGPKLLDPPTSCNRGFSGLPPKLRTAPTPHVDNLDQRTRPRPRMGLNAGVSNSANAGKHKMETRTPLIPIKVGRATMKLGEPRARASLTGYASVNVRAPRNTRNLITREWESSSSFPHNHDVSFSRD